MNFMHSNEVHAVLTLICRELARHDTAEIISMPEHPLYDDERAMAELHGRTMDGLITLAGAVKHIEKNPSLIATCATTLYHVMNNFRALKSFYELQYEGRDQSLEQISNYLETIREELLDIEYVGAELVATGYPHSNR